MQLQLNKYYNVPFFQTQDGDFILEEMKLVKITEYKNEEVFIFEDSLGLTFATHTISDDEINWELVKELNNVFSE